MVQTDVLDDPRWQANMDEKQGRFRFDRYRYFAFNTEACCIIHVIIIGSPMPQIIPGLTVPEKQTEYEYHVNHTLGWSLQLTNITLTFDAASDYLYYGKVRIKCDLEQGHCPSNHAIKATGFWKPENHCRIFDVGRSHARMIKFQKSYFIETLKIMKLTLVTNTCHTCTLVVFKNTFF